MPDQLAPSNDNQCACGAHVSDSFVRVFGDNDGTVERCLTCSTTREIEQGGAAGHYVSGATTAGGSPVAPNVPAGGGD